MRMKGLGAAFIAGLLVGVGIGLLLRPARAPWEATAGPDAGVPAYRGLTAEAWIAQLSDRDPAFRQHAAAALGEFAAGDPSVHDALLRALRDEEPNVRMLAAYGLGKPGYADAETIAALRRALGDENRVVRFKAVESLGKLGVGGAAVTALKEALTDKDWNIRATAARGLGPLGEEARPAVPALRAALHDETSEVREAARAAISQIEGSRD